MNNLFGAGSRCRATRDDERRNGGFSRVNMQKRLAQTTFRGVHSVNGLVRLAQAPAREIAIREKLKSMLPGYDQP